MAARTSRPSCGPRTWSRSRTWTSGPTGASSRWPPATRACCGSSSSWDRPRRLARTAQGAPRPGGEGRHRERRLQSGRRPARNRRLEGHGRARRHGEQPGAVRDEATQGRDPPRGLERPRPRARRGQQLRSHRSQLARGELPCRVHAPRGPSHVRDGPRLHERRRLPRLGEPRQHDADLGSEARRGDLLAPHRARRAGPGPRADLRLQPRGDGAFGRRRRDAG